MNVLAHFIGGVYIFSLAFITVYCLAQLHYLILYLRWHWLGGKEPSPVLPQSLPFVTIQLPVFNEVYVVERLIDNIMRIDYPADRFEVQVLDDSTDETSAIVRPLVEAYRRQGFQIEHLRRSDRKGYKAGALGEALPKSRGAFIAIFDADFVPRPDFLKKALPFFNDENTGVVQARWEHLNEGFSLLTRLQAFQLNTHFTVEQKGRCVGGYLLQFNGTAGIWRRAAIDDAGGWQADTLTEDLDLSIRAQLKGWKIHYLEELGAPAELPAEMNGLKSQQFRWMKGGAETARKLLPAVWRSSLTMGQKLHGTVQLLGSTVYLFIFTMGVASLPMLFLLQNGQLHVPPFKLSLVGLAAFVLVQYMANGRVTGQGGNERVAGQGGNGRVAGQGGVGRRLLRFVLLFPVLMAFSLGLSFHHAFAVVQGWQRKQSAFVRTPKYNIGQHPGGAVGQQYRTAKLTAVGWIEGGLAFCFLAASAYGICQGLYGLLFLHGTLAIGFSAVFYFTLKHLKPSR